MDSIHHYSVITIKFSRSHVSVSGLHCFSASINHKSRKNLSQQGILCSLSGPHFWSNNSPLYAVVLNPASCSTIPSVNTAERKRRGVRKNTVSRLYARTSSTHRNMHLSTHVSTQRRTQTCMYAHKQTNLNIQGPGWRVEPLQGWGYIDWVTWLQHCSTDKQQ